MRDEAKTKEQLIAELNQLRRRVADMEKAEPRETDGSLRQDRARLAMLLQMARVGLVIHGPDGRILYSNATAQSLLGVSETELLGKPLDSPSWQLLREDKSILPKEEFPVAQVLAKKAPVENVVRGIQRPDREEPDWVLVNAWPWISDSGALSEVIVSFMDVTERKRAEERLRESEERFRLILKSAQIGVWDWDIEKDHWYASPEYYAMLGYQPVEGPGDRAAWLERVHPEDRAYVSKTIQSVLTQDFNGYQYEARMLHADGAYRWMHVMGFGVQRGEDQKATRMLGFRMDVTDRKHAEEALQERNGQLQETVLELERAQNMLQLIIEAIPARVFWKDRDLRFLGCNSLFARDGGLQRPQDLIGKDDYAMVWREQAELYRADDRQVMESGLPRMNIIEPQTTPTGSIIWVNTSKVPLRSPDGGIFGVLGVYEDITERKRAEEEKARLAAIVESSDDAIISNTLKGEIVTWNRGAERIYQYAAEEIIGRRISVLAPGALADEAATILRRVACGESIEHYETIRRRKDGKLIHVSLSISPIRDSSGGIIGASTIARDITEGKRIQDALRESEIKMRSIFRAAPIGIGLTSNRVILEVNEELCRIVGYAKDELLGESGRMLYPTDEDYEYVGREKYRQITERGTGTVETRFRRKDGRVIDVLLSSTPLDASDLSAGVTFTVLDITDRKRAEKAACTASRYSRSLIEASLDPLVTISPEGKITDVNAATEAATGYDRMHLIGADFSDHFTEPEQARSVYKAVFEKGSVRDYPLEIEHRNGKITSVLYNASVYRDEQGRIEGVVAAARDVTEIKALESQLRRAQKLEAIGTLAGGIAHDFNNILAPIIGYTEMAMGSIPETSSTRRHLNQVLTAANRAKDLVRQILAISRQGEDQLMRPVDVSIIVKEALQLLRASLPSTIQIRQDVSRATVVADASQIHQVVINLCTNAAHAMADMGILEVTLHEVDLSAEDLVNLSITGLKPGMHLELSVKDTGAGMSRDTMQKIFDPYFTTKEVGKGTGLGLAVVHGIINRHGGEILVRSEVGRGSVFDIYIPSAERTPQRERPGADDLPKGSGRVLVVDDEPAIATMVARMLERLGYSVAATTSPKEALDLFRSQPDRFDLVLTDYTMPQMVGTELANECMRIRADIPVIICSGYSERLNNEQPDKPGVKEIVMKPLNLEQLATVVRSVLNKTSD